MYWTEDTKEGVGKVCRNTTDFRHIKDNYTKSHWDINPRGITPLGPWPDIEKGYEKDWGKLEPGSIDMPEVLEAEKKLEDEPGESTGFSLDNFRSTSTV